MILNVKRSYLMDQLGTNESHAIRMPKQYRDQLGVSLGQFILVKVKNDEMLNLEVLPALKVDALKGDQSAYVCAETYNKLTSTTENDTFEIVDDIMLGTDPEFFLLSDNKIVPANRYFQKYNAVGSDGMLAEIRPCPSVHEDEVVNNIRKQLAQARERIDKRGHKYIQLHAMSAYCGITAGFHLHYGLPRALLGDNELTRPLMIQIVRAMDYYVGLPCLIQEGDEDSQRRCAPFLSYGKAGDFRLDLRTLEYRVCGGRMLQHPILTRGLLALGAVVIEDVVSRVKKATNSFTDLNLMHSSDDLNALYPDVPANREMETLIASETSLPALKHLDKIASGLESMVGLDKRRVAVYDLFNNLTTKFDSSIDNNWSTRGYLQVGLA